VGWFGFIMSNMDNFIMYDSILINGWVDGWMDGWWVGSICPIEGMIHLVMGTHFGM